MEVTQLTQLQEHCRDDLGDSVNSTSGTLSTSSDDCLHSVALKNKAGSCYAFPDDNDGRSGLSKVQCHFVALVS
jgi:hypothetical protein